MVSERERRSWAIMRYRQHQKGVATLELALLFPILMLTFLSIVQLVIYMQSAIATQYASFMAARSYQVYGDRTLKDIGYRRVDTLPYTNEDQTIAEATAEKVLMESLLWEQRKIKVPSDLSFLNRYYEDGIDHQYEGNTSLTSDGAIRVNFLGCTQPGGCAKGLGTEVTYCLPIVFPGIDHLFASAKKDWPCKSTRFGEDYSGLAITYKTTLGREPIQK